MCINFHQYEPWSMKRNNVWEGYFYQLLVNLATIMDFDHDIVELSTLGERKNTSTWTGGIGLLAKGVRIYCILI
jgi:hypothetical protein